MSNLNFSRNSIEALEARIAPASLLPTTESAYIKASFGAAVEVKAGQVLTTGGLNSGTYFLYVEKGEALVFFTDLNNNRAVDFNEMTGIAAGDGLRMTLFANLHGDIVTNLTKQSATFIGSTGQAEVRSVLSLSDSDGNPANDPLDVRGDGRVLTNSTIEKIELRSLRIEDLPDQNADGVVDLRDILLRQGPTTYSIFGNIYAGKGFGAVDGGLIIDTTNGANFGLEFQPSIGSIKTGTAASGEFFSFGVSRNNDIAGTLVKFVPPSGQPGADITGVRAAEPGMTFNLNGLIAGDGGVGARGGNITNVTLMGDDSGGYLIIAGNGGRGVSGGAGGSITAFSDLSAHTGQVVVRTGTGGVGANSSGGDGGVLSFDTFNVRGDVNIEMGDGGEGFTLGGNGASLAKGVFTQPGVGEYAGGMGFGVYHQSYIIDPDTRQLVIDPETGRPLYRADIGTHQAVDFNKDGFGDFVYTTVETSQLVVLLGGPEGFAERINLSGVRNPDALTVADLNGDGQLDIAVASLDAGSHQGIAVFLNRFENDGAPLDQVAPSQDINGNGRNDFIGFRDARYSTLPQLRFLDPRVFPTAFFVESPLQISSIVAGQFSPMFVDVPGGVDEDGNPLPPERVRTSATGYTELAVMATYYARATESQGHTTSLLRPFQVIVYLVPDLEEDNITGRIVPTGQFYADFGTKGVDVPFPGQSIPPEARLPFALVVRDMEGGRVKMEATALHSSSTHDVVIAGFLDTTDRNVGILTLAYDQRDPDPLFPAAIPSPTLIGAFQMGEVDVNRQRGGDQISRQHVSLKDFVILDYTYPDPAEPEGVGGRGIADLAILSAAPQGFVVFSRGDGTGSGTQESGNGDDQSGNYFGPGPDSLDLGTNLFGIRAGNFDGEVRDEPSEADEVINDFVILRPTTGGIELDSFRVVEGPATPIEAITAALAGLGNGQSNIISPYYPDVTDRAKPYLGVEDGGGEDYMTFTLTANDLLAPIYVLNSIPDELVNGFPTIVVPLAKVGAKITAGDGGNSLNGRGGVGGSIGGGSRIQSTLDPVTGAITSDLIGTLRLDLGGDVILNAGTGGNGFSHGGAGGNMDGVSVRYNGDGTGLGVTLGAGDGGRGVSGTGGNGGSVLGFSLQTALQSPGSQAVFNTVDQTKATAGDGGVGIRGGNGGSVIGNGTRVPDSVTSVFDIRSGNGGDGTRQGGKGGDIKDLSPNVRRVENVIIGGQETGRLIYIAGHGGDSVAGPGGDGGSILNNNPRPNARIDLGIYLVAGDGGNGVSGGKGGSIVTMNPTFTGITPRTVQALAGHGGDGVAKNGGEGGSVSDLNIPSRGLGIGLFFPALPDPTSANRILAGDGGDSAGATGGNGGGITNVRSSSPEGSFAVAAGAGGHGLKVGGNGGSVSAADISLGASTQTKGLVIAGAGGDASAFVPNPNDPAPNQAQNAFGGTIGKGGNGGSIVGFSQSGNQGAHSDLIAGNGGSTLNYGVANDDRNRIHVGFGGSIRNVNITGNIGQMDATSPIKAYNDIFSGQTVADYVNNNLRGTPVVDLLNNVRVLFGPLTDADGNVGIVVGSAGRNKAVAVDPADPLDYRDQPATGSRNGSLIDLTARNLMSAIAGSVDRIASILVTQNIRVPGGIVGADKLPRLPPEPDTRDYLDAEGNPISEPVRDGRLVDGALVTTSLLDARGRPTFIEGRVYIK